MSVTSHTVATPAHTGVCLPPFGKPYHRTMLGFTEALQAEQGEVLQVLLMLGAYVWQTKVGKALMREYLGDLRSSVAPSRVPIPPVN